MQKPIRRQTDDLQPFFSEATGLDCGSLPDLTRQEFKDETDVNKVLARYGVNTPMREAQYGTVDYDLDLQQALTAISRAQDAIRKLPPKVRDKYPTWEALHKSLHTGAFRAELDAQKALDAAAAAAVPSREPLP